jgi:transcriptional regulator with XRE-family HTH domain
VKDLGLEIKVARIRARLTQHQLGVLIGVPSYKIARLETGTDKPTPEQLQKICVATGVDMAEVCDANAR